MTLNTFVELNFSEHALLAFLIIFCLQTSLYVIAAGGSTLLNRFFHRLNLGERIELKENYPNQIWVEVKSSIKACLIISLYFFVSFYFIKNAHAANIATALFYFFTFIAVYDLYMYITHRLLHTPTLRRFHATHHRSISTTPWSCLNLHAIEASINYLPFLLFAYFTEVPLTVFLATHIYLIFGIANGHSNYNLFTNRSKHPLLTEFWTFHQGHHSDGRSNYGYLYTHYDWLFGTRNRKNQKSNIN